jgi:hypothetical protein
MKQACHLECFRGMAIGVRAEKVMEADKNLPDIIMDLLIDK